MEMPWAEFGGIALAHALAVVSPGPDFAVVLSRSLAHGRRPAIWTSFGIGAGILVHSAYTVAGLGLVLAASPKAFVVLKVCGAAYLGWLGLQSLRFAGRGMASENAGRTGHSPGAAWLQGFLTNVLNPKAALFFIALFPALVNPATPRWVQAGYGVWMALATAAWFTLVATLFTREAVRARYRAFSPWVDRILGVVFLAFAVSVAAASVV